MRLQFLLAPFFFTLLLVCEVSSAVGQETRPAVPAPDFPTLLAQQEQGTDLTQSKDIVDAAGKATEKILPRNSSEFVQNTAKNVRSQYTGYSLFLGFNWSPATGVSVLDPEIPGESFFSVDCTSVAIGERCGPLFGRIPFQNNSSLDDALSWHVSLDGPLHFFDKSSFGYKIRYKARAYKFTRSGFITGKDDSFLESHDQNNAEAKGESLNVNAMLFYALVRSDRTTLLFGVGLGIGYLTFRGYAQNGYISTGQPNPFDNAPYVRHFDFKGFTADYDLSLELNHRNFRAGFQFNVGQSLNVKNSAGSNWELEGEYVVRIYSGYIHYF